MAIPIPIFTTETTTESTSAYFSCQCHLTWRFFLTAFFFFFFFPRWKTNQTWWRVDKSWLASCRLLLPPTCLLSTAVWVLLPIFCCPLSQQHHTRAHKNSLSLSSKSSIVVGPTTYCYNCHQNPKLQYSNWLPPNVNHQPATAVVAFSLNFASWFSSSPPHHQHHPSPQPPFSSLVSIVIKTGFLHHSSACYNSHLPTNCCQLHGLIVIIIIPSHSLSHPSPIHLSLSHSCACLIVSQIAFSIISHCNSVSAKSCHFMASFLFFFCFGWFIYHPQTPKRHMMCYSIFSCALLITKLVNSFFYHSKSFTTLWPLHKSFVIFRMALTCIWLGWFIAIPHSIYHPHPHQKPITISILLCACSSSNWCFLLFFSFFFSLPHHSSLQLLSSAQKLSSSGSSFAFCLVNLFTIPIPAKNPLSISIFSCVWQFPHHQTSFPLQHSSLPTTIFWAKSLLFLTGLKFIVDNPSSDKSYLTWGRKNKRKNTY